MGLSKGMLPVEFFCTNEAFCVSVVLHGDHKTVLKLRRIWPPSVLEIMLDLKRRFLSIWRWLGPLDSQFFSSVVADKRILLPKNSFCVMEMINLSQC